MKENETQANVGPEHTAHEIEIVVNGALKVVTSKVLTFAEVVALAYSPVPSGPNIVITVTYRRGANDNPQGELFDGQSVRVKKEMVFNVTATDKS